MSSLNRTVYRQNITAPQFERNHHGLKVTALSPEAKLTRLTMAHMLWEKQFYVDGQKSADLMASLVTKVSPSFVSNLARQARDQFKLRHVPLHLMRSLAKVGALKAADLAEVIQRPDELSEFVSLTGPTRSNLCPTKLRRVLHLPLVSSTNTSLLSGIRIPQPCRSAT